MHTITSSTPVQDYNWITRTCLYTTECQLNSYHLRRWCRW